MRYERPEELIGYTKNFKMSCGNVYITFNFDSSKNLCEVFMRIGRAGGCQGNMAQGFGRMVSISLQEGIAPNILGASLIGMQCPGAQPGKVDDPSRLCSCLDGMGKELIKIGSAKNRLRIEGWDTAHGGASFEEGPEEA